MADSLKALLVDDDEDDFLIIDNLLNKIPQTPFKLEWVSTPEAAKVAIAKQAHDIYLVDYRLGQENGL